MNKSKVAVMTCNSYDPEQVYNAVKAGVDAVGGIGNFVNQDEKILLKPNFLMPSGPDKCVTTHPSVINAVVRILKENGYTDFKCGDSPANGSCKAAFEKAGLDQSMIAPMDKEAPANKHHFAEDVVNADAIIGICKMKTHQLERITGAVKNMYGLVCGYRKAAGHVSYPSAAKFAEMMVDIHKSTPQRLHIMDGIVAMEGNGPSSGTAVDMGLILVSADPVALDSTFCRLINLDPCLVPTNTYGYVGGIGTYKDEEIEIILDGSPASSDELVKRFGKPDYKVQREKDKLSVLVLLSHITGSFGHRPYIDQSLCVKCGVCVEHCPVEGRAVSFASGKDKPPVYDYKKCIRCFCCQEICPQHAIKVR